RAARERHAGGWNKAARLDDQLVEAIDRQLAALPLHRRGIVEAGLGCPRTADHAPQIGTDQIAPALVEGVAGLAFLGGVLPAFRVGVGEALLGRLFLLLARRFVRRGAFPGARPL